MELEALMHVLHMKLEAFVQVVPHMALEALVQLLVHMEFLALMSWRGRCIWS